MQRDRRGQGRGYGASLLFLSLASSALVLGACDREPPIYIAPEEIPPECEPPSEPRHYQVFFVVDVSGSMEPFLRNIQAESHALATGFPEVDEAGRGVRVDYFLVAFVNDYKFFGGRMSWDAALGAAIETAISAGGKGNNLNTETANVDIPENLLDALMEIPKRARSPATTVVVIATDAEFPEAPAMLSGNIQVQSTYKDVYDALTAMNAKVHAFTRNDIPGLTAPYRDLPPLTGLAGSSASDISALEGETLDATRARVRAKLNDIAHGAACRSPVPST